MKIFSVHRLAWSPADDGDAVFVKEGFSWPAFLFGPFWSLWNAMWLVSAALIGIAFGLSLVAELAGIGESLAGVLQLALHAGAGIFGNDMRRWSLRCAGYVESAIVTAPKRIDAEHRYFAALLSCRSAARGARP